MYNNLLTRKKKEKKVFNDTKELFEPITNVVIVSSEELIKDTKYTTKALEHWIKQVCRL